MQIYTEGSAVAREAARTDLPLALRQRNVWEFEQSAKQFNIAVGRFSPGKYQIDISRATVPAVLQYLASTGCHCVDIEPGDVVTFTGNDKGGAAALIQRGLKAGVLKNAQARRPEELEPTFRAWIYEAMAAKSPQVPADNGLGVSWFGKSEPPEVPAEYQGWSIAPPKKERVQFDDGIVDLY